MKMGNIAARVGIKPPSFAFWVRILTITPPMLPDVTILPTPTYLCGYLPKRSVQPTIIAISLTGVCHLKMFIPENDKNSKSSGCNFNQ